MRRTPSPETLARLLPPGRRWGFGAHSVLPYLALALSARAAEEGGSIRNPVFPQMDKALRVLHPGH